jgi:ubiquitin carboxyl-terminal hydrolase 7
VSAIRVNMIPIVNMSSSSIKSLTAPDRIEAAPQFYDFLVHRRVVRFHPHPTRNLNPEELEAFSLVLSARNSYDQIAAKVGDRLGIASTHLRFWTVNATTNNPKASVKRGPTATLQTILNPPFSTFSNNNQRSDSMYYEVLDISLSELDTKKPIRVTWLSEGLTKEVSLLLHENSPCLTDENRMCTIY